MPHNARIFNLLSRLLMLRFFARSEGFDQVFRFFRRMLDAWFMARLSAPNDLYDNQPKTTRHP